MNKLLLCLLILSSPLSAKTLSATSTYNANKMDSIKKECLIAAEKERAYWRKVGISEFYINQRVSKTIRNILKSYSNSYPKETNELLNFFIKKHLIIN